jgi:flagellar hook-basal body complex protein FliE
METFGIDEAMHKTTFPGSGNRGARETGEGSFSQFIKDGFSEVDRLKKEADKAVFDLAAGKNQDIHNTMISVEKAGVAFELMAQVRNRVIKAYEEVMRMQF